MKKLSTALLIAGTITASAVVAPAAQATPALASSQGSVDAYNWIQEVGGPFADILGLVVMSPVILSTALVVGSHD